MVAGAPFEDNAGGTNAGTRAHVLRGRRDPVDGDGLRVRARPADQCGFGYSVATTGGTTAVGAYTYDVGILGGAGAVECPDASGSGLTATWPWSQKLSAPSRTRTTSMATRSRSNGSVAVVGAPWDDGIRGSAHVYEKTGPAVGPSPRSSRGRAGSARRWRRRTRAVRRGRDAGDGAVQDSGDGVLLRDLAARVPLLQRGRGHALLHGFGDGARPRDRHVADHLQLRRRGVLGEPVQQQAAALRFYKPSSSSHFYTASRGGA